MPQTQADLTRKTPRAPLEITMIEAAEDAIIGCSLDGVIHTWNAAAERLLGYPAPEVLGQPASLLDPEEQTNVRRSVFTRVMRGERVRPFTTQLVGKDAHRAEVSLAVSPIIDRNGNVIGVLQIARDIGEELCAQRLLHESEQRLRVIVDSSPFMIWSTDAGGKLEFINQAYRRFLGKGQDDVTLDVDWRSLVHPDDRTAYAGAYAEAVRDRRQAHAIARVRRIDGEWRWVESFGRLRFAHGEVIGMVGCSVDITDRKLAEEALRRREEELTIITDGMPALISYIDNSLRYRFVNLAYEKWFGEPRDTILGNDMRSVLGDEAFQSLRAYIETALHGEAILFETWAKYRKGGARYIHANYLPRRAHDGQIEGFFVLVFDLTARKLAEEALRESEMRERARADILDALMEHVPTGITIVDADGKIRMVSRYGQTLTGHSQQSLSGMAYDARNADWDILRPDGAPPSRQDLPLTRSIEDGEVVRDEEWIIRRRDGSEIAVLTSAGPIRNKERRIVGGIVAWHDISERKRAEERLRQSEEALRRAQQVAHIGSFDYDISANRVEWSPQLYEIFGVDPNTTQPTIEMALGQVHPEERDLATDALNSTLQGGPPFSLEARVIRPDGSERVVLGKGEVTARDAAGQATRLSGTVLDITERKRIEADALRAQKLESIGLLAGGIAHDFNNLLTAVFGNIQLAEINARGRADVVGPLQQAEKAFQAARALTHQLLTFSRGGEPVRTTIDIRDLLRDSVGFALHGSNIESEFDVAADLRPASVDREQMDRAISNIVINAKEAMPNGGRIRVTARNVVLDDSNTFKLAGGHYIETCFADTGSGIEPEILDNIFDPYFTTKAYGTGLGLPTVYSIVKRHEGHVTVQSEVGRGARFCLHLPASMAVKSEAAEPALVINGDGRVLLMDDDPLLRRIGAQLVESLGYHVTVAANGDEAVALYRHALQSGERFAAVILDLTVPGAMGGEVCLQRLREVDPAVRAIVSSGYSTDPIVARYRDHGFAGMVPKPYRLDELSSTLARVVREGRANQ